MQNASTTDKKWIISRQRHQHHKSEQNILYACAKHCLKVRIRGLNLGTA
jgi:hypothetical protein